MERLLVENYFARLAEVESGGNPFAKNPKSSAKGMFQFIDSTAKEYGITAEFGTTEYSKQEIDAVKRFTSDNQSALKSGLGREPTDGELYLAHQQGAKGALNILNNPNARAVDLVGEQAIALNAGNADMTAKEFSDQWGQKFGDEPKQETFSVELPDGTFLQDIPLGTTKEQIRAKLAKGGYDVTKLDAVQEAEAQPMEAQPEERQAGFVQRTGEALEGRIKNVGKATQATLNDEQSFLELAAQGGGQGIGFVGDVLGNAAISGYRYLPDSEYGLGEAASLIGSIPTGTDTNLAGTLGQGINYLVEQGRGFANENPRAARNLGAAGNIGAAVLPIKGANAVGQAGVATGKAVKGAGQLLDALIPKIDDMSAEVMKRDAGQVFRIADELSGGLRPDVQTKLFDNIKSQIDLEGATLPKGTQVKLNALVDKEGDVKKALAVFESLKGQPLTLEGFKTIDQKLGSIAYSNSISDDAARKVIIMQRELRKAVETAKPSDFVGESAEGFETYKRARELWAKSARMDDLEKLTAKAFATDQPTNSLKRALGRFLADKDNTRGFSKLEIDAISEASKTGVMGNMVRMVSGRLPSSVSVATDPMLAPALSLASTASRSMSDDVMLGKMQQINNLIASGQQNTFSIPKYLGQKTAGGIEGIGSIIEKAYSGNRGNLATLGTLQQLQREQERKQQNQ